MSIRIKKRIAIAATALLLASLTLFVAFPVRASANSAQQYWQGIDAYGTVIVGDECPLEVTHENLTFTMKNVDMGYSYDEDDHRWGFVEEDSVSEVTAEYEFYNPADFDVQVRLAFPYYINEHNYVKIDQEQFGVTADGEKVETAVRHTYADYNTAYNFATGTETAKLRDDYATDEFFSRDMLVTRFMYTVEISNPNGHNYASTVVKSGQKNTLYALEGQNGSDTVKNGWAIGEFVRSGDTLTLYAIGDKPSDDDIAWEVYTDAGRKKKVTATVTKKYEESTTLGQLIDGQYESANASDDGVSAVDWYNATIDMYNSQLPIYGGGYLPQFNLSYSPLMHWYEYTIEVPSKATVINTVTAPMIPSVDRGHSSTVYGYKYLLSPAKGWSKFGSLDIIVNTPYYIVDSTHGFTKADEEKYTAHYDALPDGELEFSLCTSQYPTPIINSIGIGPLSWYAILVLGGIALGILLGVGAIVCAIVVPIVVTRKRRKATKQD